MINSNLNLYCALLTVSLNIQLSYLLSLTRALVVFNVARVLCLNLNRIAMMHVV